MTGEIWTAIRGSAKLAETNIIRQGMPGIKIGLRPQTKNIKKNIERSKKYYHYHREACLARKKLWRIKNEEKVRGYNKKYKLKHKIASL